jgi:hypothetical protein
MVTQLGYHVWKNNQTWGYRDSISKMRVKYNPAILSRYDMGFQKSEGKVLPFYCYLKNGKPYFIINH